MAQPGASPPVVDHNREPCPDRILDDLGGAFSMGAVGGGLFHACKSMIWGPRGHKFRSAFEAVRKESPRMGGSFAVWGGLFSSFECTLVYFRQKEDHWNPIASGALTGGLLSARMGPNVAFRSAVFGGVILAAIEALGVVLQNSTAPPPTGPAIEMPHAESSPPPPSLSPGGDLSIETPLGDMSGTGSSNSSNSKAGGWLGSGLFGAGQAT